MSTWRIVAELARDLTEEQARQNLGPGRYAVNDEGHLIEAMDGPITVGRVTPDVNGLMR